MRRLNAVRQRLYGTACSPGSLQSLLRSARPAQRRVSTCGLAAACGLFLHGGVFLIYPDNLSFTLVNLFRVSRSRKHLRLRKKRFRAFNTHEFPRPPSLGRIQIERIEDHASGRRTQQPAQQTAEDQRRARGGQGGEEAVQVRERLHGIP